MRARLLIIVSALVALAVLPSSARAAGNTFTAPYSEQSAYWGCQPNCDQLHFQTEQSASKQDGSLSAAASMTAPVLKTLGSRAFAVGEVWQYLTQAKPVPSASATITFTLDATTGANTRTAQSAVAIIASIWNANCSCEAVRAVTVAETVDGSPGSFTGSRSVTVQLFAPSVSRPIKGTIVLRARLMAEAELRAVLLTEATAERSVQASAQAVVTRMTYSP